MNRRGISPIITISIIVTITIATAIGAYVWFQNQTNKAKIEIEEGTTKSLLKNSEELVVENFDGNNIYLKNNSLTDIYIRKNNLDVMSIFVDNNEVDISTVIIQPDTNVIRPGEIVTLTLPVPVSFGQTVKITTENRYSVYFTYMLGNFILMVPNPQLIWANDGNDNTYGDRSEIKAVVTDNFGNPASGITVYFRTDIGSFENGLKETTSVTDANGIATTYFRSRDYVTGEVRVIEGKRFITNTATITSFVEETFGGQVLRRLSGQTTVEFAAIDVRDLNGNYYVAIGAGNDEGDSDGNPLRYRENTTSSERSGTVYSYNDQYIVNKLSAPDSSNIWQNSGSSNSSPNEWMEIVFPDLQIPSNASILLVQVYVRYYVSYYDDNFPYNLNYRDYLRVCASPLQDGRCSNWANVSNIPVRPLEGFTYVEFISPNLVSWINTPSKANSTYIRLYYNPSAQRYCFMYVDYADIRVQYVLPELPLGYYYFIKS